MIFSKQVTPLIKVVSMVEGLTLLDEIKPKPSLKYMPEWWKNVPFEQPHLPDFLDNGTSEKSLGNVKSCPSFPDYFSSGIIIPMWSDVYLRYKKETGEWNWNSPFAKFAWEVHSNHQFLDYVPFKYFGKKANFMFKAICPWKIITPPGYSVYQLPLFYHFNNDFSVLPGIIDTDRHHAINQQVVHLSDNDDFIIKRGTPFVQYIPFKREKYTYSVEEQDETTKKIFLKESLKFNTKFLTTKDYVKDRLESTNE